MRVIWPQLLFIQRASLESGSVEKYCLCQNAVLLSQDVSVLSNYAKCVSLKEHRVLIKVLSFVTVQEATAKF
jgi:hypothetical protein